MKSYVTMAVCPICQEDTGEILMDRKMRNQFEMRTMTPMPCDACKTKYLKKGVMLINPKTCSLVVIKKKVFHNLFDAPVPKGHIAFCEQGVLDRINEIAKESDDSTKTA